MASLFHITLTLLLMHAEEQPSGSMYLLNGWKLGSVLNGKESFEDVTVFLNFFNIR